MKKMKKEAKKDSLKDMIGKSKEGIGKPYKKMMEARVIAPDKDKLKEGLKKASDLMESGIADEIMSKRSKMKGYDKEDKEEYASKDEDMEEYESEDHDMDYDKDDKIAELEAKIKELEEKIS